MQNFNQQADSLSANEAHEVLNAWTNRQQAQGVDPSVNSVTSLAAGLGVSEDEVRRILEDIRVQQRSQQIASGILQQEQKHRKRLDITAAILAAGALVLIGVFMLSIFMLNRRAHRDAGFEPEPPAVSVGLPGMNLPGFVGGANKTITVHDDDGTTTIIDQNGIHIEHPNGKSVQINDPQAMSKLAARLGMIKAQEAAAKARSQGGKLTPDQERELTDLSKQEADIKQALKDITSDTPTPPPATPATGR